MAKNTGGLAFPTDEFNPYHGQPVTSGGLTKREWFAGMALIGIIMNGMSTPEHLVSEYAFKYADAMIKENEKEEDGEKGKV